MKRSVISCSCLLILGLVIWWMSANVVWLGDDLDYKYMMKGEIWQSWGRIKSLKAFCESQLIHYQHVNGRFVAHTIVQLFNARLGQQAFAISNAIVYVLFALLLAKAGKRKTLHDPGCIITAICLSVLCFITKMMPTCQIGYIWAMTANLFWLQIFFRKGRPSWRITAVMILCSPIVGNWQESISIGVCAGLCIWWISHLSESRKTFSVHFDWRRSWMILGYVAGTASNCFAPSTIGRIGDAGLPPIDRILISAYSFPAILILIISIVYTYKTKGKLQLFSFRNEHGLIPKGVLTCGIIMLVIFNPSIGIYSNRQLFGANLLAAILTLEILPRHRFSALLNALMSVAVIAFWGLMLHGIKEVRYQYDDIVRLHAESCDGSVCFDRKRVMTLGFPLRAKYYEDILGQFDNDLHHSLMKDFKHVRKGKTLKLKPTAPVAEETVVCYAPGHFTAILKEPPKGEAPRELMVYGHYPIFGLRAKPRKIQVTRYSNRSKRYGASVIIPEFPFFTADSIAILPYSLGCGTNHPIATP